MAIPNNAREQSLEREFENIVNMCADNDEGNGNSKNICSLKMFNLKKKKDINQLRTILKSKIKDKKQKDKENKDRIEYYNLLVNWLEVYVNSPQFINLYSDKNSLHLVAEATYFSVQLGLAPLLEKMSYGEIRSFRPLEEMHELNGKTEWSETIRMVANKMIKPTFSLEASFALGQAAWAVYVHKHSFEIMKREELVYARMKAKSSARSRL